MLDMAIILSLRPALVVSLTLLNGCLSQYIAGDTVASYTDARTHCANMGGKLSHPEMATQNKKLSSYLESKALESSWIEPVYQIVPWFTWDGNEAMQVRDQGCYSVRALQQVEEVKEFYDGNNCVNHCLSSGYQFAGVQRRGTEYQVNCVCTLDVPVLSRKSERNCSAYCYNVLNHCGNINSTFYRLIATKSQGESWRSQWNDSKARHRGLCSASTRISPNHTVVEQFPCHNLRQSICCINKSEDMLNRSTFFKANHLCAQNDHVIALPESICPQRVNRYDTAQYWTNIRAWNWFVNGSNVWRSIYTNWDKLQPDVEHGLCVQIRNDGFWGTADCNSKRYFVCDTENIQATTLFHYRATRFAAAISVGVLVLAAPVGGAIYIIIRRKKNVNLTSSRQVSTQGIYDVTHGEEQTDNKLNLAAAAQTKISAHYCNVNGAAYRNEIYEQTATTIVDNDLYGHA